MLQAEAAEFIAQEALFHISGGERTEKRGDAGRGEMLMEQFPKSLFCLIAKFRQAPGIGRRLPHFWLEEKISRAALLQFSGHEIVPVGERALLHLFPEIDAARDGALLEAEGPFVDEPFLKRGLMGLQRGRREERRHLARKRGRGLMVPAVEDGSCGEEDLKRSAAEKKIEAPKKRKEKVAPK